MIGSGHSKQPQGVGALDGGLHPGRKLGARSVAEHAAVAGENQRDRIDGRFGVENQVAAVGVRAGS